MYLDLARMPHKYLGRGRLGRSPLRRRLGANLTIPGRRDLGTVSIPVAGSMVYGSSPVARNNIRYPVFPVRSFPPWQPSSPVIPITGPISWGPSSPGGPISPGGGYPTGPGYMSPYTNQYESPYGGGNQYGQQGSLALAQNLLATNPGALTPQQWAQLQAAGSVPGTLPYSSAGQVTPSAGSSSSAIDPATGVPYATELAAAQAGTGTTSDIGTALQTDYAGLPLFAWLLIGGGAVFMLSGRRGR